MARKKKEPKKEQTTVWIARRAFAHRGMSFSPGEVLPEKTVSEFGNRPALERFGWIQEVPLYAVPESGRFDVLPERAVYPKGKDRRRWSQKRAASE